MCPIVVLEKYTVFGGNADDGDGIDADAGDDKDGDDVDGDESESREGATLYSNER